MQTLRYHQLPDDWCEWLTGDLGDLDRPGIYEWRIGDAVYVGKSKNLAARLREYPRNLRRLLAGLPYRKGKPTGFRSVHHALGSAYLGKRRISCSILETCALEDLNELERVWIAARRRESLSGGARVLNG